MRLTRSQLSNVRDLLGSSRGRDHSVFRHSQIEYFELYECQPSIREVLSREYSFELPFYCMIFIIANGWIICSLSETSTANILHQYWIILMVLNALIVFKTREFVLFYGRVRRLQCVVHCSLDGICARFILCSKHMQEYAWAKIWHQILVYKSAFCMHALTNNTLSSMSLLVYHKFLNRIVFYFYHAMLG